MLDPSIMNRTAEDTLRPMQHYSAAAQPRPPSYTSTSSYIKSKALKLWPIAPADQATPKADPKSGRLLQELNPFDAAITTASGSTSVTSPTLSEAFSDFSSSPISPLGNTGPTFSIPSHMPATTVHHKLLNAQPPSLALPSKNASASAATTALATATAVSGATTPAGKPAPTLGRLVLPAAHLKDPALAAPSKQPTTPGAIPSPRTPQAPPFRRTQSSHPLSAIAQRNSQNHPSGGSRGQIHVKLIQARGLTVPSHLSRPYVVVQFEQSEFVSREAIANDSEKEVKGKAGPLSRTSSSLALPVLGAANGGGGGISRAFEVAARTKAATLAGGIPSSPSGHSNSSSDSSTSTVPPQTNGLFGTMSPHNPVWKHEVSFDVTLDQSLIYFSIYTHDVQHDTFVGRVDVKPILIHDHTVDRWLPLQSQEDETVTGEIRLQITYEQCQNKRALTPRDFEFLKLIGRGTFGRVFQVRKRDTRRIYAMKVLSKKEIIAKKEVAHTIGERKILQRSLECPFLVGLKFSFQTDRDLYFVIDFKSGGELFWHLQHETKFSEERARFYIAELVLALEHLHKYDIMYRDLKPENILLDATGHVALCDFGLSKPDLKADQLTNTFCGTTEYLAPEVLLDDQGYSKTVDFWSLGVLLFEMCCGWSPFYAEDVQQMYKNICFGKIKFPRGVIGEDGKQFVKGLLNRNPKHRLGAQRDTAELKEHPFFKNIDWDALGKKQVTPPFKPIVDSDESTNNFDPEFTSADLRETGIDIFDEEDLDDDRAASLQGNGTSKFNGPASARNPTATATTSSLSANKGPVAATATVTVGSAVRPLTTTNLAKKTNGTVAQTPLSNSVQENFRGFTYQGESTLDDVMDGSFDGETIGEEDAYRDEDVDDWEDEDPVGRYRKQLGVSE